MFMRRNKNLPQDPTFPADLKQLGYMLNSEGEFVKIADPDGANKHFTFFVSNSDRLNEVHKEAMHIAAREVLRGELSKFGVRELFLAGGGGDEVLGNVKPDVKHMVVLTTDLEVLKEKNDVIVIVGEPNQDMGVWAYRSFMREGGLNGGTVVGMMKKLRELHLNKPPSDLHPSQRPAVPDPEDSVLSFLPDSNELREAAIAEKMPGIIILNPGQLHYSHAENQCMSWATWAARKRSSAIAKGFQIDEVHNRVPGHTTPEEHITTMFEKVIPQLIREDAKIYVIGVTDGAERFINWMDAELKRDTESRIAHQVHAMAFTEPTHLPYQIHKAMSGHMSQIGRAWIRSSRKLGTLINSPSAAKKILYDGYEEDDRVRAERKAAKARVKEDQQTLKDDETDDQVLVSKAGNEITTHEVREEPSTIEISEAADAPTDPQSISPTKSHISNYDDDFVEMRALGESIELFKARKASRKIVKVADSVLDVETIAAPVAVDDMSTGVSVGASETDDEEGMKGSYDYTARSVSMPTFSGGVAAIEELLVPAALDQILGWFVRRSEEL